MVVLGTCMTSSATDIATEIKRLPDCFYCLIVKSLLSISTFGAQRLTAERDYFKHKVDKCRKKRNNIT